MGQDIGGLFLTLCLSVTCAICGLLILHRTIDGDVPVPVGVGALVVLVGILALSIKPPFPALPGVTLVVLLTLMAGFPFALTQLDHADLRSFHVGKVDDAYEAYRQNPGNISARLNLAHHLYEQGLPHHAIAIADLTLDTLSQQMDPISNRSLRDHFRAEDHRLVRWKRDSAKASLYENHLYCTKCRFKNELNVINCAQCQHPYLLDITRRGDDKPKMMGKLLLAWACLAAYLVGSAWIGFAMKGIAQGAVFLFALVGLAGVLAWLFKKPTLASLPRGPSWVAPPPEGA